MRFGACVKIEDIPLAKDFGYDLIELSGVEIAMVEDDQWNYIRDKILHHQIPVIGFNNFCDEGLPLVGPDIRPDDIKRYTATLIKRGADLGIRNIGIGSPKARILPDGFPKELADGQMLDFLTYACQEASHHHINIALEAINPHMCNYINKTSEAYELIQNIDYHNIGLVYDVFHAMNSDERYSDSLELFSKILHVHVCSWDKELNRYFVLDKDYGHLQELSSFLKEVKYDGTVSIEADDISFLAHGKESLDLLKRSLA